MTFLRWALLIAIVSPFICSPQQNQKNPMDIAQGGVTSSSRGAVVELLLTNRSLKDIVGFVLWFDFSNQVGGPVLSSSSQMRVLTPGAHGLKNFAPGLSIHEHFNIPINSDGQPVSYKWSIDYVRFSDGSGWGPDVRHMSMHINGILQGARGERARLRTVLKENGPQVLIDEVNKNP